MKKIALLSALALASCATIIDEKLQLVEVTLEPNVPAECTFTGDNFKAVEKVPGAVRLQRSYYPLDVNCVTQSGEQIKAKVYSNVSSMGYAGSVLGLGVGGVVDASTGQAFEYPEKIVIKSGSDNIINRNNMNNNVDFE